MFIGRITGRIVSTHKVDSMTGQKLFIVEPLRVDEQTGTSLKTTGRTFVVIDTVGAGEGEVVLCVQGSSARFTDHSQKLPIDAAVIGIVDEVHVHSQTLYNKSQEDE